MADFKAWSHSVRKANLLKQPQKSGIWYSYSHKSVRLLVVSSVQASLWMLHSRNDASKTSNSQANMRL